VDYQLTIRTRIDTHTRRVTAEPDNLAQAVHRHARGILGAPQVNIHINPQNLTGTVTSSGATAGTFTLAATTVPETDTRTRTTLYGYGLDDLHHLARHVVHADRWHAGADIEDRYDAAWHAIIEHLLTADQPPTRADLFRAGIEGSDQSVRQTQQAHGYNHHQPGTGARPNFHRYWFLESAPTPSPENRVVERHALWQIWPKLTTRQQEALTALAATGDYQQAATHLGVTQGTFHVLIANARKRFLAWWHEHEEASRPWGTDRRVGSRNATIPATTKRRPATRAVARRAGRPVHELVHGKASTYTNHACRCAPCTKAATDEAANKRRRSGVTARRRITISQLADIRTRHTAGETLTAIAADLGFSDTYLSRLLSGARTPAPDPA
jgi:hypothetical protein